MILKWPTNKLGQSELHSRFSGQSSLFTCIPMEKDLWSFAKAIQDGIISFDFWPNKEYWSFSMEKFN